MSKAVYSYDMKTWYSNFSTDLFTVRKFDDFYRNHKSLNDYIKEQFRNSRRFNVQFEYEPEIVMRYNKIRDNRIRIAKLRDYKYYYNAYSTTENELLKTVCLSKIRDNRIRIAKLYNMLLRDYEYRRLKVIQDRLKLHYIY